MRGKCEHCGIVDLGEAKIAVQFTLDELEDLAFGSWNKNTRERLVFSISLIDEKRAKRIAKELPTL